MSREYKKRKRAESEAETRQRITEATDAPARDGRAGAHDGQRDRRRGRRAARHRVSAFPRGGGPVRGLRRACGFRSIPPPTPRAWPEIADPDERLRTALGGVYSWYERTEEMQVRIARDRKAVPALDVSARAIRRVSGRHCRDAHARTPSARGGAGVVPERRSRTASSSKPGAHSYDAKGSRPRRPSIWSQRWPLRRSRRGGGRRRQPSSRPGTGASRQKGRRRSMRAGSTGRR